MLKRDDLNVRSEKAVFKAVFRYCTRIAPEQKLEALTRLLPLIHFPLLSGDFLARYGPHADHYVFLESHHHHLLL